MKALVSVLLFAISMASASLAAAQSDPALGTWKLNLAKSTFMPGPAPRASTLVFEQVGKGRLKSVQEVVPATGEKMVATYTAEYDGRDYPITGWPAADTVQLRFSSGTTVQRIDKKGGKIVSTYLRSISRDGTMTVSQKGTTPDGKPVDNTLVYEKQK
jgi:hypothetical protein